MKKRSADEMREAWSFFMGLCEDFPELYENYVQKIEKDLEKYKSKIDITKEEKKQAIDKIWKRIENENLR